MFSPFKGEKNKKLEKELLNKNSVAVHIRCGDYLGTNFDVLTVEYYKRVIL